MGVAIASVAALTVFTLHSSAHISGQPSYRHLAIITIGADCRSPSRFTVMHVFKGLIYLSFLFDGGYLFDHLMLLYLFVQLAVLLIGLFSVDISLLHWCADL